MNITHEISILNLISILSLYIILWIVTQSTDPRSRSMNTLRWDWFLIATPENSMFLLINRNKIRLIMNNIYTYTGNKLYRFQVSRPQLLAMYSPKDIIN
jgi:hypothetical protein